MWSTGEGNGKPLQYFCLESPMNSMKRQKDSTHLGNKNIDFKECMLRKWMEL